ncbi:MULTISPECIES: hypothetical protein [unclassified Shinella]|uniref:hypothetical protein n=1 Tax=Shinella TaxID=323620 RepID=UPI00225CED77|nr:MULTISPECIES: hypothetical protein [unclassified Shinella]CAI0336519.1 conserved hypothetical protein [Rhizobiaceae bacterium]CAK7255052.1 conserved protein of unknown function [Shinella sp. WSC3-e]MCO5136455.1 hypothetical protein [Shinella sp.]MCW5709761.1 hypothetical protein [Shinella sp.]MDC7253868.1 hypothetical protein [Shinella sp. YE25]
MSDDSTKTMWAIFATREAADRAVEHLVQQCGIDRADVFIEPDTHANTAGVEASGGDTVRADAPLHGEIRVSADIARTDLLKAEQAFRQAGARSVMAQ